MMLFKINKMWNLYKQLNTRFLLMFFLSMANLLLMHVFLALTVRFEYPFKIDAIFSNLFSCLIDTTFLFTLSMLLTWGHIKRSLFLTYVLTALLSFCNIFYSRFFDHYLPNLAFMQWSNLNDTNVMESILTGFSWIDLFFICWAILFYWLYKHFDSQLLRTRYLSTLGWLWGVMLSLVIFFIIILAFFHDHDIKTSIIRFSPIRVQYTQAPNNMLFRSGFLRRALVCYEDFRQKNILLDKYQKDAIWREYTDYSKRATVAPTIKGEKNLIFIIVESYLAVTSDLVVDGKEITPFLNRLKRDSSVYYNGHVRPNIEIGESSDGQFIYMTGLLPLRSEITVNIAKNKSFYGLPAVLMERGRLKHSHIIVPTSPTFWEQDAMNKKYGIETMFSKFDYEQTLHGNDDLNDAQIFEMASHVVSNTGSPFFSLVLTMSMHNPYNKCVEHGFQIADKNLPSEYLNYLVDCHYTDYQIEQFINKLKRNGLYDKSVIVITADHQAHSEHLNMDENMVSKELPLFIINGEIDKGQVWTGPCNQLDVYTTLLDMFGVNSPWRGFGQTLLDADYREYSLEQLKTLSDWVIRSDYFRTQ